MHSQKSWLATFEKPFINEMSNAWDSVNPQTPQIVMDDMFACCFSTGIMVLFCC